VDRVGGREMGIEMSRTTPQNQNMSVAENRSLEAKGLQIWGDVRFRADALIGVGVKGGVQGAEKIIVTQDAVIEGAVEGSDVKIEGQVQGGVSGRGQVWIGAKAKVKVGCCARSLRIEPGAEFRGELQVG